MHFIDTISVQVSFNPTDNRHVCVAGISVFKQYHYQDEALTVFMLPKVEYQGPQSYLCMAWASPEWLLLGLDCNQVQLFENGELKQEFTVIQDSNDFLRSAQVLRIMLLWNLVKLLIISL